LEVTVRCAAELGLQVTGGDVALVGTGAVAHRRTQWSGVGVGRSVPDWSQRAASPGTTPATGPRRRPTSRHGRRWGGAWPDRIHGIGMRGLDAC
jgi:hypothetical protein